ncbi:ribonuclease R [Litoreibacter roseus]|uniref:Ribonuclease R n=1 Tax=Litoreibacter roseus TaxID=2601869 RepID=A0A6N6JG30_9RHOB|nr:ribonuclease R [Litoreibacter roseus]GFE64750.1 ribonuclease R [Litoreibacter roseus]
MSSIPTKDEVLAWISDHPTQTSKRDIAKAFGIKGAARIDLKRILNELADEGHLQKRRKTYRDADALPPVSACRVDQVDENGDLFLEPVEWSGEDAPPKILFIPKRTDPALGVGDRALYRLAKVTNEDHAYEARLIRRIGDGPSKILGLFKKTAEGGRIIPIDKGADKEWRVPPGAMSGAKDGELVEAEQTGPKARMGLPQARIVSRLGDPGAARSVSLIAIHQHGIPDAFPDEVIAEAEAAEPVQLGKRTDLRDMPLVTIDPADARDHDDACYAEADDDPKNPGGHVLWVAIADVAHYVQPGSALDREARKRGNSTYFPDRVVPMLPEALSGDLCSLHEGVDRACVAVRMVIDAKGKKLSQTFMRGLMRSPASLNYEEVQAAFDGASNDKTAPFLDSVIRPLYAAYRALVTARASRQPLNLDLPERRIALNEAGRVISVAFRDRLDAHKLIEEFMVLANVAAAETLNEKKSPLLFRVHEEPSPEKLESLREIATASGFVLAKGQVLQTRHLNQLLSQAANTEHAELMNISALRSMTQAYYAPENFGHFGLALRNYAHFTSPIRRYADLIVHRALISAHGWGNDGLDPAEIERLKETGELISDTERRSMVAERDTTDRYLASFLADRVGTEFEGRISGIVKFGVFVKLDDSGADGLVPVSTLGREYFVHDRDAQTLTGERSGATLSLGQRVLVRLAEATPATGGLTLELLELDGKPLPNTGAPRRAGTRRKLIKNREKGAKLKKKARRR